MITKLKKLYSFHKFKRFVKREAKKHEHRKIPITWFTSDLHFGHAKVIDYCDRPFKDAHQMNVWITNYWNAVVKPFDTVYVLGDFSMNPNNHYKYIPNLPGTKILIVGNHDHALQFGRGNQTKKDKVLKVLESNWAFVKSEDIVPIFGNFPDGYTVKLTHMPYRSNFTKQIDDRFWQQRPEDEGHILLCGHQHARYIKSKNMIDVGFDGSLCFYSESDIIKLIEDPRNFIPSRITDFYNSRNETKRRNNY